jgi:spermidine synthase
MSSPSTALFATTVFASAFLIFFVQPMVGKHILPWFGGSPSVWTLCLAFYQLTLFAGYGYAHWLNGRVRSNRQLIVHAILFATALLVLPVLPDESWKPEGGAPPSLRILSLLAANVGPPFLLLAATGPLLQAWFARAFPGRSPYKLYAVSNVGSLLALLAYPFLVEPQIALSAQSGAWSWVFVACGFAVLACGGQAFRAERAEPPAVPHAAGETTPGENDIAAAPSSDGGITRTLLWILLPACAVTLFMGVTNELCLDVASIPFLWILPLVVYLTTFIVCFGSDRLYRRGIFATLALLSTGLLISARVGAVKDLTMGMGASPIAFLATLYLLALFFSCMLVHGELYRLRPSPEKLTAYYFCVSGGGALGGLFVAIVAPWIFSEYYELPFGWLACLLFSTLAFLRTPGPLLRKRGARRALAVVVATAVVTLSVLGVRAIDTLYDVTRGSGETAKLLYQTRNFFSIMRVMDVFPDEPEVHHVMLKHGTTNHGTQFQRPSLRRIPVSYFGVYTGMGMMMNQRPDAPMHVGIMGLGAGTLAAYGRPGDRYQFYEIDPDVIRVTRDDGYFSYLADSRAAIRVVPGDARLSLERQLREGGSQNFDLLIMDAFSSDSVPVHLITLEAMQLYHQHLKPGGVLVVHISNVNLDLGPLVFRLAAELDMHAVRIGNRAFSRRLQSSADWMILSKDAAYIESFPSVAERVRAMLRIKPKGLTLQYPKDLDLADAPLWTDDYSDLFSVLKAPNWKRLWASPGSAAKSSGATKSGASTAGEGEK